MPTHVLVFYSLLTIAACAAILIGGRTERQVAAMLVAATCGSKLVAWQSLAHFARFETALFTIDVTLLAGLGWVALRSDRYWPIWMTALHAYSVIAHVGRALITDTNVTVYLANSALTADPGLLLLTVASWRHWRRHRFHTA